MRASNDLVTAQEAAYIYGRTVDSFSVNAFNYRKKHNKNPKWYMVTNGSIMIDTKEMNRPYNLLLKIWQHNTDSEYGLYWVLNDKLGFIDAEIAKYCSSNSKIYPSLTSWHSFLSSKIFATPSRNTISFDYNMQAEFTVLASKWLRELIDKNKKQKGINAKIA